VLRNNQLVRFEADGQRRIYELDVRGFAEAEDWFARYRKLWSTQLDVLARNVESRRKRRGKAGKHRADR
jgi:hypothetical protein